MAPLGEHILFFREAEQWLTFVQNRRRSGVEVLRAGVLLVVLRRVPARDETNKTGVRVDREDQSIAEGVDERAAVGLTRQSGSDQLGNQGSEFGEVANQALRGPGGA